MDKSYHTLCSRGTFCHGQPFLQGEWFFRLSGKRLYLSAAIDYVDGRIPLLEGFHNWNLFGISATAFLFHFPIQQNPLSLATEELQGTTRKFHLHSKIPKVPDDKVEDTLQAAREIEMKEF